MPRDYRAKWINWLLPALIFLAALAFRLAPLGRYVTPDEPAWVIRSIRFGQALAARDLSHIPTTGHPGVTTMWLGSLGVQFHRWLDPAAAARHLAWIDGLAGLSPTSPAAFAHLAHFLPGGRLLVALGTSLGIVAVFDLARRLWGVRAATLGAALLALDPFLAGHGGLLHLDGLLATTMTLSVLAALSGLVLSSSPPPEGRGGRTLYRWAALSGLFGGLAALTKTPGGFVVPAVGLLLIGGWFTGRLSGRTVFIALLAWGATAALVFVALYPALWVDPLATLRGLFDVGGRHVGGALRPIFFRGQFTFEPGPGFYPVAWLFRVSPPVLLGLPLAYVHYARRPGSRRLAAFALSAFALGFALFVTLVGKKHDRYLLPAFPPLSLVAALGWEGVIRWGIGKWAAWRGQPDQPFPNLPTHLLLATLIVVQLLVALPYRLTPLGYFNPLAGGPRAALDWLPVGWGEGLGAAARWLNRRPRAERLIVASPSLPPLASLFRGRTTLLTDEALPQADYLIRLPPSTQRPSEPAYDFKVGGVSYAQVLPNPAPEEQAAYLAQRTGPDDLILLDAAAALAHRYDGPATLLTADDAADPPALSGSADGTLWYVALPAASPITARQIESQLACLGPPLNTATVAGATIYEFPLDGTKTEPCGETQDSPYLTRFGDHLALVDAYLPDEPVAWPAALPIVVRWRALSAIPVDYHAILHLKDAAGHAWAEGGREILDADYRRPSAWTPGHRSDQTFALTLPPALPPGAYSVELGVFDPASRVNLSAWDAGGRFAGLAVNLGRVTVAPSPDPPAPGAVPMTRRLDPPPVAGPLVLLGYDPPPTGLPSGDRASFDLFWQARVAPQVDLSLRWRLRPTGKDGGITGTVPLSPYPTSRWRAGALLQVRYDLPAPPELPAGAYVLSVNPLAPDGAPLWSDDRDLARVEILARDRLFSLPAGIEHPLDFRLGDRVHLRGFDVGELTVDPGDRIPLTLYWQADGPTDRSYTVFVHLVGPDGMAHGQVDRPPADGAAPTTSWAPGQVIIDALQLPVRADAPRGTYHVALGLYDPLSADRLPVYGADGAEQPDGQVRLPIEVTVR